VNELQGVVSNLESALSRARAELSGCQETISELRNYKTWAEGRLANFEKERARVIAALNRSQVTPGEHFSDFIQSVVGHCRNFGQEPLAPKLACSFAAIFFLVSSFTYNMMKDNLRLRILQSKNVLWPKLLNC
jgi:hypothetical protein